MSKLSHSELNALQEPFAGLTISLALALSEQINMELILSVAQVKTVSVQEIMLQTDSTVSTVFSLASPFSAESLLLTPMPVARIFADLLGNKEVSAVDETDTEDPLQEAQIKLLAGAMQSSVRSMTTPLASRTGDNIEVEACNTQVGPLLLPPVFALDEDVVEVRLALSLPGLLDEEMTLLVTPEWARGLLSATDESGANDGLSEDDLAAMLNDIGGLGNSSSDNGAIMPTGSASAPPFPNFPTSAPETVMPRGMNMILDIPLDVTVELGRVRMLIKDVLELAAGSIVELDRVAGEPVDLLVNGRLVAKGEVVVIEDNFGIRITEIVSQADRLAGLGKGR